MMFSHLALTHEGHMKDVSHVFVYLKIVWTRTCIRTNSSRYWYGIFPKTLLDILCLLDSRSRVEGVSPSQHAIATWTPICNANFCGLLSCWWVCDRTIKKWVHFFLEKCAHLLTFKGANLMWDKYLWKWICSIEAKYGVYSWNFLQAKNVWHTSNWTVIFLR